MLKRYVRKILLSFKVTARAKGKELTVPLTTERNSQP